MLLEESYLNERLDHLGIVAGVCQEIGLANWLDAQEPGRRQQVSVGTATVAMVLNGLGWSLRQLYLVPQFPRDAQRVRLSVIDTAGRVGSSKRLRAYPNRLAVARHILQVHIR